MSIITGIDVIKKGTAFPLYLRASGDLTTASPLVWRARRSPDGAALISKAATFVSYDPFTKTSLVRVDLTPTETNAGLGRWLYEVAGTIGSATYVWPSDGFGRMDIVDDLA